MTSTRPQRAPVVIFGVGLFIALTVVLVLWGRQSAVDSRPDPYWFSAMAESLLRGDGFTPFGTLLHRRAPLYPLFIAALYAVGGKHALLVQIAQSFLHAGTGLITYDIGRRVFNERTGRVAAAIVLVHPALLRYVPDFHLETMLTFLSTLSVWSSVRFVEQPKLSRAAGFGALMALTTLTKAVMLLYPFLFIALWWWRARSTAQPASAAPSLKTGVSLAAVMFVVMAVVISPWTVRNYRVSGHFVPVSTGLSDAFLRGYVFSRTEFITLEKPPYTDAENEVNAYFRQLCEAEGTTWEADDYETDRILNRAAREKLVSDPLGFVRKSIVGVFTFWYQMTSRGNSIVVGGAALLAWLLAAVGLVRARREGRRAWLVLAPILYLNLLLAVLLSLGRYSVPVLPCLMVLSGFGIDTLIERRRARTQAA